jgi:hypothetical protein
MATVGHRSAYDIEFVGLSNEQAVYVSLTIAERELLWARTGVIQNTTVNLGNSMSGFTTSINDMLADNILSAVEKIGLWFLFKAYSDERDILVNNATSVGVAYGTYSGYVDTMRTQMLTGINPGISYNAGQAAISTWMGVASTVTSADNFRTSFANVGSARSALLTALSAHAEQTGGDAGTDAGQRNRTYFTDAPPYGSYNGLPVIEGDHWFNANTSQICPDTGCWGHTVDPATLMPRMGNYGHSAIARAHVWHTGAWVDAGDRSMLNAARFPNGIVTTQMMADSFQTADYQGVGSGASEYANRGVKIRRGADGSPGILTSAEGIRIGPTTLDQAWFQRNRVAACTIIVNGGTAYFTGSFDPIFTGCFIQGTTIGVTYTGLPGTRVVCAVTPSAALPNTSMGAPIITGYAASGQVNIDCYGHMISGPIGGPFSFYRVTIQPSIWSYLQLNVVLVGGL